MRARWTEAGLAGGESRAVEGMWRGDTLRIASSRGSGRCGSLHLLRRDECVVIAGAFGGKEALEAEEFDRSRAAILERALDEYVLGSELSVGDATRMAVVDRGDEREEDRDALEGKWWFRKRVSVTSTREDLRFPFLCVACEESGERLEGERRN